MTTELQPSPPGYSQDEGPGLVGLAGVKRYRGGGQQCHRLGYAVAAAGERSDYHRRAGRRSAAAPTSEPEAGEPTTTTTTPSTTQQPSAAGRTAVVDGHEERRAGGYCRKNAPGYKNDSGYSESLGFESFSLPLSERDAASPPPTPPVRDASSLKAVCYGPGHEKYPSWPSAPECRYDEHRGADDEEEAEPPGGRRESLLLLQQLQQQQQQQQQQDHHHHQQQQHHHHHHDHNHRHPAAGGSHRSKSWTDHTNYPKEKPAQYTRPPHAKRPNSTFTQQLKTVMEKCEKIPAETFESRSRNGVEADQQQQQQQLRMWPSVDREGKTLGDAEYVVPSPPERESLPSKTLSPADLEAYVRSYQDPQVSQVELYGDSHLIEAGLEEYTTVQHSQQASYAQSEGYHSYVSSVDSTTTTPFLDRLRRDSEAVAQRPLSSWEDGSSSREGRDSVVTTSSGSASSSETLKWHGSMSDVSVSSGMPMSRSSGMTQDRWHHGSMSDISSINGSACPPIMHKSNEEEHDKWQESVINDVDSVIDHHHNQNNNNHHHNPAVKIGNRLNRDSWQVSMNDRNKEHGNFEDKIQWDRSSHSMSKSFHSIADRSAIINDQSTSEWDHSIHSSMSDVSQMNNGGTGTQGSKQLIAHSARVQTPQRHHSESVLYMDRERSQRKLYPVSTTKLDDADPVSRLPPSSPQQAQLSVAERISELEKQQYQQQQMRYTYLDPEKRHRVSDPTLKAIQKKALLSFYERYHHQASWRSEPHLLSQNQQQQQQQNASQQRHSPPPQPPPRPRPTSSRRASSASDYASGAWREKISSGNKATQQQPTSSSTGSGSSEMPEPRHQHSNSCGSLATDLLGPVIVGPAISIDDWVPERPPKKPHLRTAYSDRLPSPDLPPPSPPTVTDVEVLNFDDPLPPPPPELSQICSAESGVLSQEQRHDNHYYSEPAFERIKERRSSSRRSTRKKAPNETSPTSSPTKSKSSSPNQDSHSFHFGSKSSSTMLEPKSPIENGFSANRMLASGRSSLRYTSSQKNLMNEKLVSARRNIQDRLAPYGLANQLPDLIAQKYSDSGHQRPAPQVPFNNSDREAAQTEPKIKKQESLKLDEPTQHGQQTAQSSWPEAQQRQKPRPQVPKGSGSTASCVSKASPKSNGLAGKYQQQQQQQQPRNFFALPPKYSAEPQQSAPAPVPAPPTSRGRDSPPPLAPRTPGKKMSPPPRPAPPAHAAHQG